LDDVINEDSDDIDNVDVDEFNLNRQRRVNDESEIVGQKVVFCVSRSKVSKGMS
jgi:hypothetical protein